MARDQAEAKAMKRKAMQHAKMEQMKKKSKMSSSMIGKGITIRNLIDRPLHFRWKKAWKLSGLKTECGAFVLATVRLFLWHLLQPCLFMAAFYHFNYDLKNNIADGAFWFPGLILSIREATYSVITIICAIIQPSFLLVDTVSSFPDDGGKRAIMLYILAPEKLLLNWTESCLDQMSKENAFDVAEQEGAQKASLYMQGCCIKLTSFVVSVSSFIAFLVGEFMGVFNMTAFALIVPLDVLGVLKELGIPNGKNGFHAKDAAEFFTLPLPLLVGFVLVVISAVTGISTIIVDTFVPLKGDGAKHAMSNTMKFMTFLASSVAWYFTWINMSA